MPKPVLRPTVQPPTRPRSCSTTSAYPSQLRLYSFGPFLKCAGYGRNRTEISLYPWYTRLTQLYQTDFIFYGNFSGRIAREEQRGEMEACTHIPHTHTPLSYSLTVPSMTVVRLSAGTCPPVLSAGTCPPVLSAGTRARTSFTSSVSAVTSLVLLSVG